MHILAFIFISILLNGIAIILTGSFIINKRNKFQELNYFNTGALYGHMLCTIPKNSKNRLKDICFLKFFEDRDKAINHLYQDFRFTGTYLPSQNDDKYNLSKVDYFVVPFSNYERFQGFNFQNFEKLNLLTEEKLKECISITYRLGTSGSIIIDRNPNDFYYRELYKLQNGLYDEMEKMIYGKTNQ